MKWSNKLFDLFKQKSVIATGGMEVLQRIFGGSARWNKTKQLATYTKSLYVFACVRKIAEKVGAQDIRLFKVINSRGDTVEIFDHPALDLLYRVNPFQTKSEFLEITETNLKLSGDAFWWKIRNNSGQVAELWNLRPDMMTIIKDDTEFIKGYEFTKTDGSKATFAPDDIIHFKYPNPLDQYYGMSPVSPTQVRIDTEEFASQYQRDFFLNNARPDAILKFENNSDLTEETKTEIRKGWNKRYKGVGKNSKIAILEGEVTYQQLSMSQREMDYIDSMKFTRDDILVAFAVPKPIVAITDDVNRANAETAMHIFLSETIHPELNRLEEKINEQLIIPEFGDDLFIEFPDPTPENRELTLKEYEEGIKNGYMLINEVREKENLLPVDGGWDLRQPLNQVTVGTLKAPKKATKNYIFRGKGMLKFKLALKEKLTKEIYTQLRKDNNTKKKINATIKSEVKKEESQEKDEKTPKALIKGEELRENYYDMVNKQIDQRTEKLKGEMSIQASRQQAGVIKIINENLEKNLKEKGAEDLKVALTGFFATEDKIMASFILPFIENSVMDAGLESLLLINGEGTFETTEAVQKRIEARSKLFGKQINETTKKKLSKSLAEGITDGEGIAEMSTRVNKVYKEYPDYRSELIARTETTASNNEGFIEGFRQSGVATHKEWVATLDDKTRHEHVELNGDIVRLDKNFENGLAYPQEPNCRCVIAPAFED